MQNENKETSQIAGFGKIRVEYSDYEEMKRFIDKSAIDMNFSPHKVMRLKKRLTKGGRIKIYIYRPTEAQAHLEMFSYITHRNERPSIVQKGGMYRERASVEANPPSGSGEDGEYWTNADMVQLHEPIDIENPLKLSIVDKDGGSDEFIITKTIQPPTLGD